MATATIANGASLSNAVALPAFRPHGFVIQMPATWTAAALTFQGSVDGTNYFNIYTSAAELTTVADASRLIALAPEFFGGLRWIKVRSGTAGSPVNQGAERLINIF